MKVKNILIVLIICILGKSSLSQAQTSTLKIMSEKEVSYIEIAIYVANGDLKRLKNSLEKGLESGLEINQIKESILHIYAYAGFPRSIRGLQTFMEVLNERKEKGIIDTSGK